MNYSSLDKVLNTNLNMEITRNASADTATDTLAGVDWFKFDDTIVSNVYVESNSRIGFCASNIFNLNICYRDGAVQYIYREEGTILNYFKFLKIRWEGTTYYSSNNVAYTLVYELFLFDTGDIFLNVIKTPTASSYFGTSSFVANNATTNLTICDGTGSGTMITFYHLDETGQRFDIKYEKIKLDFPFTQKYLISDASGKYYTVQENALVELLDITELTSQAFINSGLDVAPDGTLLQTLMNPKVLYWINSDTVLPEISATLHAIPFPQIIKTNEYFMTHPSIKGLKSIEIDADSILTAISFDGSIWQKYEVTGWIGASKEEDGMTVEELQAITAAQFAEVATTGHYWLRFVIGENSVLRNCKINYVN